MEEIDIKQVAAQKAKEPQVTRKSLNRIKMTVAIITTAVMVILISMTLSSFLQRTDFGKDVPLSESLSRWDNLQFVQPETIKNSMGTWSRGTAGYVLDTNEKCIIRPIYGQGPATNASTDAAETELLKKSLNEGGGALIEGENVIVPVDGVKGGVEFASAEVTGTDGDQVFVLYRGSSQTGTVYTISLSCGDDTEAFAELKSLVSSPLDIGVVLKR
jgi:hypothetical protein